MSTLSAKAREKLRPSDFVFPKTRQYPIPDENHARNALARVAQYGTAAEKAAVQAAVRRKFPKIGALAEAAAKKLHAEPKGERDKGGEKHESAAEKRREMLSMAAKRKLHAMRARGEG